MDAGLDEEVEVFLVVNSVDVCGLFGKIWRITCVLGSLQAWPIISVSGIFFTAHWEQLFRYVDLEQFQTGAMLDDREDTWECMCISQAQCQNSKPVDRQVLQELLNCTNCTVSLVVKKMCELNAVQSRKALRQMKEEHVGAFAVL